MENLNKRTLPELLKNSAEKFKDRIALGWVNRTVYTYEKLKEKVEEVASFLEKRSIKKGDRVAILSENMPNFAVAYFAAVSIGAICVPIMTEFHESEVNHVLRHSESSAIFVSSKLYPKIEDAKFDHLHTNILIDDFSVIPQHADGEKLKDFFKSSKREMAWIANTAMKFAGRNSNINEEDTALILYTSGTTGHSKGVMLSHKNIVSNALMVLDIVTIKPEDRMLSVLPLFHTFESTLGMVTPILGGCSVYYLDKPPTAAALLPALQIVRPTIMLSVPLIIEKIVRMRVLPQIQSKKLLSSLYKLPAFRKKINKAAGKKLLKTFGGKLELMPLGGAALAEDVEKFLKEAKFPYSVGYGLTETSPLATGTKVEEFKYRSAGRTIPEVEIKIDNPDPNTGEGEILIKGPNVMQGYYKEPEKTKEVLSDDGWFRTGDLGYIDSDNFVFIKGRLKNVIIGPSGKNIYPEEIESIINAHEYAMESLVHEKDEKLCARIHLNYEKLEEDNQMHKMNEDDSMKLINKTLEDIKRHVNANVASYNRIASVIEQQEPFEKTPTHKIKRFLYV